MQSFNLISILYTFVTFSNGQHTLRALQAGCGPVYTFADYEKDGGDEYTPEQFTKKMAEMAFLAGTACGTTAQLDTAEITPVDDAEIIQGETGSTTSTFSNNNVKDPNGFEKETSGSNGTTIIIYVLAGVVLLVALVGGVIFWKGQKASGTGTSPRSIWPKK